MQILLFNIIKYDNILIRNNKGRCIQLRKIETILHPVRFRIIQRFLDGQQKTVKELAKELKDIPPATLYRQLDTLVKSDILVITKENQIRGTVEKVYALNLASVNLNNTDLKNITKEEHLQYFLFFTAQLTKSFETYLESDDIDFERDGVGYRQIVLNLSNEEFHRFRNDLRKVYEKYIGYTLSPNRTRRTISTVMIPEKERGKEYDKK